MRLFLVIGLLFICFMGGVLYGMNKQYDGEIYPAVTEEASLITTETNELEPRIQDEAHINVEEVVTPAYKVASALESVVNFFYEIIVQILLQISKLFF